MIDLRYHIASIVAIFLALGLGVLIGSTIVGDDLLVDQQRKMLERLEQQFNVLKSRENELVSDNEYKNQIISNYENYSQAVLPYLVKDRMAGYQIAVVVTGSSDIPAGMLNTLTLAGASVVSKTVVLSNISLTDAALRDRVIKFYNLEEGATRDEIRKQIAYSVAAVISNKDQPGVIEFLEENELIKFGGNFSIPVDGFILLGGTNSYRINFAKSFDQGMIEYLSQENNRILGVETSGAKYSYMEDYQNNNISTIDNVDLSPGQISMVLAMEGEAGHYGIKSTAQKFVPSLPVDSIGSADI